MTQEYLRRNPARKSSKTTCNKLNDTFKILASFSCLLLHLYQRTILNVQKVADGEYHSSTYNFYTTCKIRKHA